MKDNYNILELCPDTYGIDSYDLNAKVFNFPAPFIIL